MDGAMMDENKTEEQELPNGEIKITFLYPGSADFNFSYSGKVTPIQLFAVSKYLEYIARGSLDDMKYMQMAEAQKQRELAEQKKIVVPNTKFVID